MRFQKTATPLGFDVNVYTPLSAYPLTRRNEIGAAYVASHCDRIAAKSLQ
jgi:hypothetical protein